MATAPHQKIVVPRRPVRPAPLVSGGVLAVLTLLVLGATSAVAHGTNTRRAATGPPAETPPARTTAPALRAGSLTRHLLGIPGQWKLVLNAEFNRRTLNTSIWQAGWFGTGVTTSINPNETACYSSKNVLFPGDGTMHLALTATQSTCGGVQKPYTGALVSSNPLGASNGHGFQYTYGVLEASVYLPPSGTLIANWPAIMTLGQQWPVDGEDDVLEGLGGTACFHFHSPETPPVTGAGECDVAVTPGWHTFAADWQPGRVTYYYDGTEITRVTQGITSAPMFIVLVNTASRRSPDVAQPAAMQVAYIRVWQPTGAQASRAGYTYSH
jgi:beta-glucanase (GH16 family)